VEEAEAVIPIPEVETFAYSRRILVGEAEDAIVGTGPHFHGLHIQTQLLVQAFHDFDLMDHIVPAQLECQLLVCRMELVIDGIPNPLVIDAYQFVSGLDLVVCDRAKRLDSNDFHGANIFRCPLLMKRIIAWNAVPGEPSSSGK